MKLETVRSIQENVKLLHEVVVTMNKLFDTPVNKVVEIMLQNVCLNTEHCKKYSLEEDIKNIHDTYEALIKLTEYHEYHFLQWICDEYARIVDGYIMPEENLEDIISYNLYNTLQ